MHAITLPQDPAELRHQIREVTAAFIAAGIDPKRHIVFNQSQVSEHAELAWVFNCVARVGWSNRMTQFKEKAGKDRENASIGLYAYPVLMAADILVYRATHVPVGEDQKQHLELTRDIAQKFNNDWAASIAEHGYGDAFFPLTEPLIQGPATRIMSLRDGSKKMSKSDPSDYSRINLTDDADTIAQKVRKAKTDPEPLPSEEKGLEGPAGGREPRRHLCRPRRWDGRRRPRGSRRLPVLRLQGGPRRCRGGEACADCRRNAPPDGRSRPYRLDPRGRAQRARTIARPTMDAVKDIVGFVRRRLTLRQDRLRAASPRGGATVEHQATIVRDRPPAEIHGRGRRDARMRPCRAFRGAAGEPHRSEHPDARRRRRRPTISSGSASAKR